MRVKAGMAAVAVQFAIIPLYGTLIVLDPARPPIPTLLPHGVAAVLGILALVTLAAAIPAALPGMRRDALTVAFLAPGAATIVAAIPGFDPPLGIGLGLLIAGQGASAVAVARVADAAAIRLFVRSLLWSAIVSCALALAMQLLRRPAALFAYDNGRAVGTFLNPNELAAYALVALGVAVPFAVASRGRDRLATVAAIVLAVTLLATYSRFGLLCAVLGIAVYAVLSRARVLLAVAVVVALAGIGLNVAEGARHHNPRDTEARAVAWQTGLTTFEHFPLLGVGPLAFPRTYEVFRPPSAPGAETAVAFDPHSLPLAFAAEGGIVAVVTLVASFFVVLRAVLRTARSSGALQRSLAFALTAALLALSTDVTINTIVLFFPLGLQVVPLALGAARTDAFA